MVSVTASAEYGAPFTVFPPKLSEAMKTKFAWGGGGGPPSGPWTVRWWRRTTPSVGGCWASSTLANASNNSVRIPDTLFISLSFPDLLNKTYGMGQTIDANQNVGLDP